MEGGTRHMSQAILVTGGAGFIGSNFVPYFCARYSQYQIINVDKLTYAGDLENLTECEHAPNYIFEQGNICDKAFIIGLFAKYDIRGVIHFAAESHVDNSITNPGAFINTNVMVTFILADADFRNWMKGPHQVKPGYEKCRFHHISTDEVYGTLGTDGLFSETTPYAPNSPYSASKAGADFIIRAYHHTFGLNTTTSNCSNNYGPKQHTEKLIPTIITRALAEKPLPVYGNGQNVRDWLYVLDHCKAIDLIFHQGKSGETYNIGGHNERNNLAIVKTICTILDTKQPRANGKKYEQLITFVTDRAGHDFRYAIDATKLETLLGWRAEETFDTGIVKTVEWYINKIKTAK